MLLRRAKYSFLFANADPLLDVTLAAFDLAAPVEFAEAFLDAVLLDEIVAAAAAHRRAAAAARGRSIALSSDSS